ncbi:MAG: ABC transporter ATP-binding protein [Chloroflexota bacterium]|nr:ABC transporter ATP-binding protein [Chloroflexota bacterium]
MAVQPGQAAIATEGLRKLYGSKVALHGLTLEVPRGEVFGFLGPNGAGKTTAVKVLTGLSRPTDGTGTLLGRPIGDREARRRLGFLPELFRFQEWLSANEVLTLHADLCRMPGIERERRIPKVLELVGLPDAANQRVGTFSKGMQQRLGLAQALLHQPELIILDEPTSALDPLGRRDVRTVIQRLKQDGVTVFLNSHLLSEVELTCDRVAIVNHGRVVQNGRVEDLLAVEQELEVRAGGVTAETLLNLPPRWRVIEHAGDRLTLGVQAASDAAEVARFLVQRGVDLLELKPRRSSLEDLFVELVEKEDDGSVDLRPADAARSVA